MHSDGQTDQRNSRRRVRGREPRSDTDAWASYQRQQNFGRVSSVAVDWSSTGFYNAELSGALNGASKAGASAAASA